MADKATTPTKVITGKCRLSFEHIWKPSKMDEDSQAKYSASIIIPKTDSATLTSRCQRRHPEQMGGQKARQAEAPSA